MGMSAQNSRSFLLLVSAIGKPFFLCRAALRRDVGIAIGLDFPAHHHCMVFMHRVMAMQRITSRPIAEAEEDLHSFVLPQLHHVLARDFVVEGCFLAVPRHDLMLLEMNVNRM